MCIFSQFAIFLPADCTVRVHARVHVNEHAGFAVKIRNNTVLEGFGFPMGGFYWRFLGHSQYEQLALIQIADLVGAAGVSFVVAMVNGLIADFIVKREAGLVKRTTESDVSRFRLHASPIPVLGLVLTVVREGLHGVVGIGVYHDGIELHLGGLRHPLPPLFVVPTRASAEKVVPVEDDAFAYQGTVLRDTLR